MLTEIINYFTTPKQGLFLVLGYLLSLFVIFINNKNLFYDHVLKYTIFLIIFGYFGNIGYNILYNGLLSFKINSGGSLLGSIAITSLLSMIFLVFNNKMYKLINENILSLSLLICVGKIGCYFGGCCGGIVNVYNIIIPLQLFEAFLYIILYAFCLKFSKISNHIYWVYVLGFAFIRLLAENFRNDNTVFIYKFPITQIIAFMLILLSASILIMFKLKKNNKN